MTSQLNKQEEFLIVGQGIAGTLLAFFLLKENQPLKVLDMPLPGASSKVAAGIINPITGRRMVKSWRFDELSDFASQTYKEMGEVLGVSFFHRKNILRALQNTFEENEWFRRSSFPENQSFFCDEYNLAAYEGKVVEPHGWGELKRAGKLDMPELISAFRKYLQQKGLLIEEQFDFKSLMFDEKSARYKQEHYSKIIFCEGSKATINPYFNYLPFATTKGECLIVKIKNLSVEKLLKNKIYITPLHDDLFWVGSTNNFDFPDVKPTEANFQSLKNDLKKILKVPFEIIAHLAGIRPTVSDKKPLLGQHEAFKQLFIFNGLGTKGSSLGPLFAEQMAGYLLGQNAIEDAVNIKRFIR